MLPLKFVIVELCYYYILLINNSLALPQWQFQGLQNENITFHSTKGMEHSMDPHSSEFWWKLTLTVMLVLLGGLFAGIYIYI